MELYTISPSSDYNKVGVFHQVESVSPGYDLHASNSVHQLTYREFPDFVPNLNYFILEKKAILTDVLSNGYISATGFLLSSRFKSLLTEYKLPEHRFYQATLEYKGKFLHDYSWFHLATDTINIVDFPNSTFNITDYFEEVIEANIGIKNNEDYISKSREVTDKNIMHLISPEKIKLKKEPELDLFLLGFGIEIYISKRLRDRLIHEGITGLEIIPVDPNYILLK